MRITSLFEMNHECYDQIKCTKSTHISNPRHQTGSPFSWRSAILQANNFPPISWCVWKKVWFFVRDDKCHDQVKCTKSTHISNPRHWTGLPFELRLLSLKAHNCPPQLHTVCEVGVELLVRIMNAIIKSKGQNANFKSAASNLLVVWVTLGIIASQ